MTMRIRSAIFFLLLIPILSVSVIAQETPLKKNSRPTAEAKKTESDPKALVPVYFYEFEKPEFIVARIWIEHDEQGHGTVKFQKKDFDETFTDKLELSETTLQKLKELWGAVNFLDSSEKFQSDIRDYGHLGTIKLRMEKDGKQRTEEFNWTEIADVKLLAEEYRKIATQDVWMFDFDVARQNQPLETPKLMKGLDSYLRRNAIADPVQMLPFLKSLTDDERVPLITRNHAARLVKQIESKSESK
ncbi:MAG: hypothetical protein R2681_11765 [Pyrinomonadaceae bacterium]